MSEKVSLLKPAARSYLMQRCMEKERGKLTTFVIGSPSLMMTIYTIEKVIGGRKDSNNYLTNTQTKWSYLQ